MRGHLPGQAVLAAAAILATAAWAQDGDYEKHVQPVFEKFCYKCHGESMQKGKLRLDTPAAILKGGESGRVVKPGKSEDSLLYAMLITEKDSLRMPPKGVRPTKAQIEAIRKWIDDGAPLPSGSAGEGASRAGEPSGAKVASTSADRPLATPAERLRSAATVLPVVLRHEWADDSQRRRRPRRRGVRSTRGPAAA